MDNSALEECLLDHGDRKAESVRYIDDFSDQKNNRSASSQSRQRSLLVVLLICSLVCNAWLLSTTYIQPFSSQQWRKAPSLTGLADRPKVTRYEGMWRPEYDPNLANGTELDDRWDKSVSGFGVVALGTDWAKQQGLEPSRAWPLDRSKSIYVFSAYHALHCVRTLRKAFKGMLNGEPVKDHWRGHGLHCFEIIREELMCTADDTLHASKLDRTRTGSQRIGIGETRQCTDWEYLRDWAGKYTAGYMTDEGEEFDKAFIKDGPTTDGWNVEPLSSSWDSEAHPVLEASFGVHHDDSMD